MTVLRVVPADEVGRDKWDAYVHNHHAGSCFHLWRWRAVVSDSLGHGLRCSAVIHEDGEVCGVLPLASVNSYLFGHSFISMPGAVEAGALTDSVEATRLLLADAASRAEKAGASHVEYRNRFASGETLQSMAEPLYFGFRRELADDDEAIMLAIPRKQRAEVRKGIAAGCRLEIDADSRRFYALYSDNVHRHGTPGFSRMHFDTIKALYGNDCEFAIVVDSHAMPISAVLSLYYKDVVYPYYAGDLPVARDISANDYKYFALMAHARKRGARIFDYGRSKIGTGPFNFKKNWGFEPVPYNYEYALLSRDTIPQNNPTNAKYGKAIATWRKLPRFAVNAFGHTLARHLC